jgi:hypothetical protein
MIEQANKYLKWINQNYDKQKSKLQSFCADKKYDWDEDIFCDTYLKIYEKILKNGIKDDSDSGFDNYTFMSFKINMLRDKQYARNQKRDNNIVNLTGAYSEYLDSLLTQEEKLKSDLYKDFACLYLMNKVEENFDNEHFYLFRLKVFDKTMTYRKLSDSTGIKGCRQKVVDCKNWLKQNVKQEDIRKEFDNIYGEIL